MWEEWVWLSRFSLRLLMNFFIYMLIRLWTLWSSTTGVLQQTQQRQKILHTIALATFYRAVGESVSLFHYSLWLQLQHGRHEGYAKNIERIYWCALCCGSFSVPHRTRVKTMSDRPFLLTLFQNLKTGSLVFHCPSTHFAGQNRCLAEHQREAGLGWCFLNTSFFPAHNVMHPRCQVGLQRLSIEKKQTTDILIWNKEGNNLADVVHPGQT